MENHIFHKNNTLHIFLCEFLDDYLFFNGNIYNKLQIWETKITYDSERYGA